MATIRKIGVSVDTSVELILNEGELRALDALAGYGVDNFLKNFYETMGRHYLEPHEAGLRSLFETVRGRAGIAGEANECREFLQKMARERMSGRAAKP